MDVMKSSAEIRKAFLDFFASKGHEVVASSPLVPGNDPTLLFTNAGMVQFKDCFLGLDPRPYVRATTVQRCVRAGGKHNDLENVGYTARHHTFFEMLGNFSFGDYFKQDAIHFAWEFLTGVLGLPAGKLWVTVYAEDDEAAEIWLKEVGVDPNRFSRIGDKPGKRRYDSDNFWSMGDTGPCGPCTEIFYDHGEQIWGGPPGTPEEDGDRYIEIWNLVFMQFDRNEAGELKPLPKPSVDTGMGLERLAAILQGGHSNYDIDIFQTLIKAAAEAVDSDDMGNPSLKVIADHIRSCGFLVVDGVLPSNEGRGYVLRRIIRRAIRHGHKLGCNQPFFHKLVPALVATMGMAYPELPAVAAQVEKVLRLEEERFAETLDQGMSHLEEIIAGLDGTVIPGEAVFKLYDTYGFPADLTADVARERELTIDHEGFEREMNAQRQRARAASHFAADASHALEIDASTEFTGYAQLADQGTVLALIRDGQVVEQLDEGQKGMVILDRTPFYAESGGQVGDCGVLAGEGARFEVRDTQKHGSAFAHIGLLASGSVKVGDRLSGTVDDTLRAATAAHHSATHLLHAALRQVLGEHVAQKGSLCSAERLRFDFSHFEAITAEQLAEIERIVNQQVRANHPVETRIMAIDEAKAAGAMALFGEKYGSEVRVLSMSDFSVELCGGTHVGRTGDIGLVKIVAESGVAAGVRRVEAVAAQRALDYIAEAEAQIAQVAELVKGSRDKLVEKVSALNDRARKLEKELDALKAKLASAQGADLASEVKQVAGIPLLVARLDGADPKGLRETADKLKDKLGSVVLLLAGVNGDKINLVASVTKDLIGQVKAGELVNQVATQVGGKGGGRPDMAMAGGSDVAALDGALASVEGWLCGQLG